MLVLAGCGQRADDHVQGYVEGEFVYVASPLAGALETLSVQRGTNVPAGAPLFELEHAAETAARKVDLPPPVEASTSIWRSRS